MKRGKKTAASWIKKSVIFFFPSLSSLQRKSKDQGHSGKEKRSRLRAKRKRDGILHGEYADFESRYLPATQTRPSICGRMSTTPGASAVQPSACRTVGRHISAAALHSAQLKS